jgi:hypothetical protein
MISGLNATRRTGVQALAPGGSCERINSQNGTAAPRSVPRETIKAARFAGRLYWFTKGGSTMTREEKLKIIRKTHDQLEALYKAGLDDEAEAFWQANWWLLDHDYNGNWIGSVKHENGWTP